MCALRMVVYSMLFLNRHRFPWKIIKPVFLTGLDGVMRRYNSKTPFSEVPRLPNCREETFEILYTTIMTAADSFTQ